MTGRLRWLRRVGWTEVWLYPELLSHRCRRIEKRRLSRVRRAERRYSRYCAGVHDRVSMLVDFRRLEGESW